MYSSTVPQNSEVINELDNNIATLEAKLVKIQNITKQLGETTRLFDINLSSFINCCKYIKQIAELDENDEE